MSRLLVTACMSPLPFFSWLSFERTAVFTPFCLCWRSSPQASASCETLWFIPLPVLLPSGFRLAWCVQPHWVRSWTRGVAGPTCATALSVFGSRLFLTLWSPEVLLSLVFPHGSAPSGFFLGCTLLRQGPKSFCSWFLPHVAPNRLSSEILSVPATPVSGYVSVYVYISISLHVSFLCLTDVFYYGSRWCRWYLSCGLLYLSWAYSSKHPLLFKYY